jgi:hypothetical protein
VAALCGWGACSPHLPQLRRRAPLSQQVCCPQVIPRAYKQIFISISLYEHFTVYALCRNDAVINDGSDVVLNDDDPGRVRNDYLDRLGLKIQME